MHWILTEFWPNSDVKSSNGSIPRRSNLSTQVPRPPTSPPFWASCSVSSSVRSSVAGSLALSSRWKSRKRKTKGKKKEKEHKEKAELEEETTIVTYSPPSSRSIQKQTCFLTYDKRLREPVNRLRLLLWQIQVSGCQCVIQQWVCISL